MPSDDPIEVGTNWRDMRNMRYGKPGDGPEGVNGYTKMNSDPTPFFASEEPDASGDDGYGDGSSFDNSAAYAVIGFM